MACRWLPALRCTMSHLSLWEHIVNEAQPSHGCAKRPLHHLAADAVLLVPCRPRRHAVQCTPHGQMSVIGAIRWGHKHAAARPSAAVPRCLGCVCSAGGSHAGGLQVAPRAAKVCSAGAPTHLMILRGEAPLEQLCKEASGWPCCDHPSQLRVHACPQALTAVRHSWQPSCAAGLLAGRRAGKQLAGDPHPPG